MADREPDMGEILDDIRTLSRGETPQQPKEPRAPRMGPLKSLLLILPAAGLTVVLGRELASWLGLPDGEFRDIAFFMPLIIMVIAADDARPASRRHWLILGATWLSAGAASVLSAAVAAWLIVRIAPESINGIAAVIAVTIAGAAAMLLVLLAAARLFRKDNLIFPRDAGEDGGNAA